MPKFPFICNYMIFLRIFRRVKMIKDMDLANRGSLSEKQKQQRSFGAINKCMLKIKRKSERLKQINKKKQIRLNA
ncbi:hypothetical protein BpHYR1_009769 [Brachionus plicatilis]|uniref:Uncharacterized protein n=1 Tax=Brachionus plicatilis TaxID=10195 RepID=A0A3M7TA19_BRAPC|nr:hypothetical protein BpHYR1_009769 [Brachionus plicatilis]